MRIAWFRDTAVDVTDPLDGTAVLIEELRTSHEIDVVTEAEAYDFVWRHLQQPRDLCVFELDNTRSHQFVWGYVANYPGVVFLHSVAVTNLRVPMLASRAVVVCDRALAELLQAQFPDANVRYAPAFGPRRPTPSGSDADVSGPRPVRFAVFDDREGNRQVVSRAFQRARNAGAVFEELGPEASEHALRHCDVVIAPGWPPFRNRGTTLLTAMAAGKPVVTMETQSTAEWPAIDPQTWRPRGLVVDETPIAVTVDPRDEEHSLMLAIRRLSSDAALRDQLGRAGRAWWETHGTPARAATAWMAILQEAATLSPPPRPENWPKQFRADGTGLAREILDKFGVRSDGHAPSPDPGSASTSLRASGIPGPGSGISQR